MEQNPMWTLIHIDSEYNAGRIEKSEYKKRRNKIYGRVQRARKHA